MPLRHSIGALLIICVGIQINASALFWNPAIARSGIEEPKDYRTGAARDREIAARFAPIFYQGVGSQRRSDYITNFDFDGDWRGDNNWANAGDRRFPLKAYVYYGVNETSTHFFIHYAVFHPRDYKGGRWGNALLSIRDGFKRGRADDPSGMAGELALAHENDMEGCLVVVAKQGSDLERATVTCVETLAHNRFLKYVPENNPLRGFKRVLLEDQRPLLYIEPKGHGIKSYERHEKASARKDMLIYTFTGTASDPEDQKERTVGYDLIPLYETLWQRARGGTNETYGTAYNYATINVSVAQSSGKITSQQIKLGSLGAAFSGKVGAQNMARPPWGWFDKTEREKLPGPWFFDPASITKRHFNMGSNFSTTYLHAPFLGVFRQ